MLAGTCGEGPWLTERALETLVRSGIEAAEKKLSVAVQVSDNSSGRVLERLEAIARWGADFGVVAQPYFLFNTSPDRLLKFYTDIFDRSPVPVIFYDRGKAATVSIPPEILGEIASHPRVAMIKDSSADLDRLSRMQAAQKTRPELIILSGNELGYIDALNAGVNGAFAGGGVITARALRCCQDLHQSGDQAAAEEWDRVTREVLFAMYGGPTISCWLAGLKYALVRLGVFSSWNNLLGYNLTDECKTAVDRVVAETSWIQPA